MLWAAHILLRLHAAFLTVLTRDNSTAVDPASRLLSEYFRCSADLAEFSTFGPPSPQSGYFRLGPEAICYGSCTAVIPARSAIGPLQDVRELVVVDEGSVRLPFDPVHVISNLRFERYLEPHLAGDFTPLRNSLLRRLYYSLRPLLPDASRRYLQSLYYRYQSLSSFPRWPVDRSVEELFEQLLILAIRSRNLSRVPFIWFWPDALSSCVILTHDVETSAGVEFCPRMMDLADSFGIKSSFQIVPEERYPMPESLLNTMRARGFEVNLHDLNHDGNLFAHPAEFSSRARRINDHARRLGAQGFRSGCLYRNIDWYDAFEFSFDMSVPNVARLDPQQGGCCTVMPFCAGKILELPLTTTQDYVLFYILKQHSIKLWQEQFRLIHEKHGLTSFLIHPDYVRGNCEREVYMDLLAYLRDQRSSGEAWIALPSQVATWWRLRSKMRLAMRDGSWKIEGEGSERAVLAFAVLDGDTLKYEVEAPTRLVDTSAGQRMSVRSGAADAGPLDFCGVVQ